MIFLFLFFFPIMYDLRTAKKIGLSGLPGTRVCVGGGGVTEEEAKYLFFASPVFDLPVYVEKNRPLESNNRNGNSRATGCEVKSAKNSWFLPKKKLYEKFYYENFYIYIFILVFTFVFLFYIYLYFHI